MLPAPMERAPTMKDIKAAMEAKTKEADAAAAKEADMLEGVERRAAAVKAKRGGGIR